MAASFWFFTDDFVKLQKLAYAYDARDQTLDIEVQVSTNRLTGDLKEDTSR
jgi:hypothetical protein